MRLPDPPPRARFETLLPMIDVVFFLVIAFMMLSNLKEARPFAVTLPERTLTDGPMADGPMAADPAGIFTLFVASDGRAGLLASGVMTGEAALAALAGARAAQCAATDCAAMPPVLRLQADAALPGPDLARLLPRLAAMGFGTVHLGAVGR